MTTWQLFKISFNKTPIFYWFDKWFWEMLLEKPRDKNYTTFWHRFWCRASNHPSGVVWYRSSGSEPDMRCKDCHDEL